MRRALVGIVLSGSVLFATAPAVLGHECYIANRSAQGLIADGGCAPRGME
jgi:hypothetical protein